MAKEIDRFLYISRKPGGQTTEPVNISAVKEIGEQNIGVIKFPSVDKFLKWEPDSKVEDIINAVNSNTERAGQLRGALSATLMNCRENKHTPTEHDRSLSAYFTL